MTWSRPFVPCASIELVASPCVLLVHTLAVKTAVCATRLLNSVVRNQRRSEKLGHAFAFSQQIYMRLPYIQ